MGRIAKTAWRDLHTQGYSAELWKEISVKIFNRYCAWKRMHPMSGGVGRVRCDSALDYRNLRHSRYDLDLVPLPRNLELSAADAELNKRVKMTV